MPQIHDFHTSGPSPIQDQRVLDVIARMNNERQRPPREAFEGPAGKDPENFADYGFSIHPEQGDLIYLLCRSIGAKRVVDFATSIGMSALYFAAAMRDNGGGEVIGAEYVQKKADIAYKNLEDAGLAEYVNIRVGDARETLRDLGGPIDFALIDGWPQAEGPTLARQMIEILAPQLLIGGFILNDNAEPDFLEYIRNPDNGFISMSLPIKRGTELALKVK